MSGPKTIVVNLQPGDRIEHSPPDYLGPGDVRYVYLHADDRADPPNMHADENRRRSVGILCAWCGQPLLIAPELAHKYPANMPKQPRLVAYTDGTRAPARGLHEECRRSSITRARPLSALGPAVPFMVEHGDDAEPVESGRR